MSAESDSGTAENGNAVLVQCASCRSPEGLTDIQWRAPLASLHMSLPISTRALRGFSIVLSRASIYPLAQNVSNGLTFKRVDGWPMVSLEKIRKERGCEVLASAIRERILSGELRSGDMLPNERVLVDQSGLSRGSVREAMRILETQGLVSTTVGRNQGRRAIQPGMGVVRDSIDSFIRVRRIPFAALMDTFETLAPSICALAAAHRTDGDLAVLAEARDGLKITLGANRFMAANMHWHSVLSRASHNPLLSAIYEGLEPSLLDPHVAGFTSKDVRIAVVHAVGRIQEAIVAGDAAAARRRMQSHVQAYRRMVEPQAPRTIILKTR